MADISDGAAAGDSRLLGDQRPRCIDPCRHGLVECARERGGRARERLEVVGGAEDGSTASVDVGGEAVTLRRRTPRSRSQHFFAWMLVRKSVSLVMDFFVNYTVQCKCPQCTHNQCMNTRTQILPL